MVNKKLYRLKPDALSTELPSLPLKLYFSREVPLSNPSWTCDTRVLHSCCLNSCFARAGKSHYCIMYFSVFFCLGFLMFSWNEFIFKSSFLLEKSGPIGIPRSKSSNWASRNSIILFLFCLMIVSHSSTTEDLKIQVSENKLDRLI